MSKRSQEFLGALVALAGYALAGFSVVSVVMGFDVLTAIFWLLFSWFLIWNGMARI